MGYEEKIAIREADLGPVIARADHQDGAVEVNKEIFYKLPPMVQEFVLCHEVCHLKHHEWDEGRTNQLAADLFMRRSKGSGDREIRAKFLSYLSDNGGYSNFPWAILVEAIPAATQLGFNIYGFIKEQNAHWYSWPRATQEANLKVMLTQAFELARRSSSRSAADYFWQEMYRWTNKDSDVEQFLDRSGNAWVKTEIAKYEKKYGFGFTDVTPIDITAYPLLMVAIGVVVGFIVYKIIKKLKK